MRITSWNVKGLRFSIKRIKILRHLKRLKTDIALLQETHLTHSDYHRMQKLWVGSVLGSDAVGCKAGVIILIHKNLPCKVISSNAYNQGRFLTIHVQIGDRDLLISNVYAPNNPWKLFLGDLSLRLIQHPLTPHVVGGDFNSTLHMTEDRSSP